MSSFARILQCLAGSKRMLLIVSPFLAIVTVLVWLAIVSLDILAAGRAVTPDQAADESFDLRAAATARAG